MRKYAVVINFYVDAPDLKEQPGKIGQVITEDEMLPHYYAKAMLKGYGLDAEWKEI